MASKFLYFAYGSNLLAQRIHINNPSAVRRTIGKLEGYRLDFNHWSHRWKGCAATIVPEEGKHTWGAIWEIDDSNLEDLDRQEGVHEEVYFPLEVVVQTPDGESLKCRSYQLHKTPPALKDNEVLPDERRPSQIYLEVILRGAQESGLPTSYIKYLEQIPHNGFKGDIEINSQINIPLSLK
ncbi:gamma-glutamylcyclotransferase isoform X2 [Anabrus simplex]